MGKKEKNEEGAKMICKCGFEFANPGEFRNCEAFVTDGGGKIIAILKKFFSKKKAEKESASRMIDYRTKGWGHSISFGERNKDNSFNVHGFCSTMPKNKDEFLHKFEKGIGVCVLSDVRPCNDPKDMFFAKAGLIRYATKEDYEKSKQKNNSGFRFLK